MFDLIDRNYNDSVGYLKQFDLVLVKDNSLLRSEKIILNIIQKFQKL